MFLLESQCPPSQRGSSDSEMSPNMEMETFAKGKEKFEPLPCQSIEQNHDQEACYREATWTLSEEGLAFF